MRVAERPPEPMRVVEPPLEAAPVADSPLEAMPVAEPPLEAAPAGPPLEPTRVAEPPPEAMVVAEPPPVADPPLEAPVAEPPLERTPVADPSPEAMRVADPSPEAMVVAEPPRRSTADAAGPLPDSAPPERATAARVISSVSGAPAEHSAEHRRPGIPSPPNAGALRPPEADIEGAPAVPVAAVSGRTRSRVRLQAAVKTMRAAEKPARRDLPVPVERPVKDSHAAQRPHAQVVRASARPARAGRSDDRSAPSRTPPPGGRGQGGSFVRQVLNALQRHGPTPAAVGPVGAVASTDAGPRSVTRPGAPPPFSAEPRHTFISGEPIAEDRRAAHRPPVALATRPPAPRSVMSVPAPSPSVPPPYGALNEEPAPASLPPQPASRLAPLLSPAPGPPAPSQPAFFSGHAAPAAHAPPATSASAPAPLVPAAAPARPASLASVPPPAGVRSLSRAPLSRAGATVLARAPDSGSSGGAGASGGGAGSSGEGGHDSDLIYSEVLARVRQEQEQLGQLIDHPF